MKRFDVKKLKGWSWPGWQGFKQMIGSDVGIDLGTSTTLIYIKDHGIVIIEPTIVAINQKTGRVVAIGTDANNMIGRTPAHIEAVRPLVGGVISNFEVAEEMLSYFLRKAIAQSSKKHFRPRVVIGVPSSITNVERRAVRDAARNAGAKEVHVRISSPPITDPCFYGIDTPKRSELIASFHKVKGIQKFINATSLHYLTLEGLKKCLGEDAKSFCYACFTGDYPIPFQMDLV